MRYKAFISYSHADRKAATWLQNQLESYKPPPSVREASSNAPLKPVFRDRSELAAAQDLSEVVRQALSASEYLIVLCSPASAQSEWVSQEVRAFKELGREQYILYLIVPEAAAGIDAELFPEVAFTAYDAQGHPEPSRALEPLAADARSRGDGRRAAFLKVAAAMLGVGYDDLAQRDLKRRNRRLAALLTASMAVTVVTAVLAATAFFQFREAEAQRVIARKEANNAEATADFLVDLFRVSASKRTNPRSVSAVSLLEEGADKINESIYNRGTRSYLVAAIGDAYRHLGEYQTSIDLLSKDLGDAGLESVRQVEMLTTVAKSQMSMGDFDGAGANLLRAESWWAKQSELTKREEAAYFEHLLQTGNHRYAIAEDAQAYSHYQQALQLAGELDGEYSASVVRALAGLAAVDAVGQRFDEARSHLERAMAAYDVLESQGEFNYVERAGFTLNLAEVVYEQQDLDAAAASADQAVELYRRVLESDHPRMINAMFMRGVIDIDRDRFDSAEQDLLKAQQLTQLNYDGEHPIAKEIQVFLAHLYVRTDREALAIDALNDADALTQQLFGADSPLYGEFLLERAKVWQDTEFDQAFRQACAAVASFLADGSDQPELQNLAGQRAAVCRET